MLVAVSYCDKDASDGAMALLVGFGVGGKGLISCILPRLRLSGGAHPPSSGSMIGESKGKQWGKRLLMKHQQ